MKKQTTEEIKMDEDIKGFNEGLDVGERRGRLSAKEDNMKEIEFAIRRTKEKTLDDVEKIIRKVYYCGIPKMEYLLQEIARLKGEGKRKNTN